MPLGDQTCEIDPRTVRAAQRGDDEAFIRLLKHYDGRARALAYRLLRDPVLMDDALQDAALKAYRALPGFRGESAVGTWLHRIVYCACLDQLRRERRFQVFSGEDVLADAASADADPCELVTRWAELEAALDHLPDEQRALVVLVHQYGYDYRTAAEVVGVPEGTVSSRLAAARVRLRRLLERPAAMASDERELCDVDRRPRRRSSRMRTEHNSLQAPVCGHSLSRSLFRRPSV